MQTNRNLKEQYINDNIHFITPKTDMSVWAITDIAIVIWFLYFM